MLTLDVRGLTNQVSKLGEMFERLVGVVEPRHNRLDRLEGNS
jgi:hypothetical protein